MSKKSNDKNLCLKEPFIPKIDKYLKKFEGVQVVENLNKKYAKIFREKQFFFQFSRIILEFNSFFLFLRLQEKHEFFWEISGILICQPGLYFWRYKKYLLSKKKKNSSSTTQLLEVKTNEKCWLSPYLMNFMTPGQLSDHWFRWFGNDYIVKI